MAIDLTGGLGNDREYVFARPPDNPEMRESVNAWVWDKGSGDLSPGSTAGNRALHGVFPAEPARIVMLPAPRSAASDRRARRSAPSWE